MMDEHTPDLVQVEAQMTELLQGNDSLVMATVNAEGVAEASYAAFVEYEGAFYVFVSELASHTKNLRQSGQVGIVLLENGAKPGHAFTRKRLTYQCQAMETQPDEEGYEAVLNLMGERFGRLISTLRGLKDFHLFRLVPQQGQFVAGFGKAFHIDCSQGGRLRHQRPG